MSDYNDLELQEQLMSQLEEMQMQLSKKRLAALRSIGQGGESLPGTEESAVQDIIREARAGIDRATAKEENSRTGRSDREAEQQRCDISTKSGIRETKHSIAKRTSKNALAEVEAVRSEYSNRERQLQTAQEKAEQERKETEAYRRSLNEQVYEQARLRF